MNSRNLRGTSFALATVRNPRPMLRGGCPHFARRRSEGAGSVCGNGDRLQARKEVQGQNRLGADIPGDAGAASRQRQYLAMMVRWYTPAEALKMATADNGELMALSGYINPYPGKLGVVEVGALADLLLVDGNPLEDINLVANRGKNFVVVMKDCKI
jgi:hypothetical protein